MHMKSNAEPRRPATAGRTREVVAAAALLASTLMAATAAQAGVAVTAAERSIRAATSASTEQTQSTVAPSGLFNESVLSVQLPDTGDVPRASAEQVSDIDAFAFVGFGSSSLRLFNGGVAESSSIFSLSFTLTSGFDFVGSATLAASGNAGSFASLQLERLGANGGIVVQGSESTGAFDYSGTLASGDYNLVAFAGSFSGNSPLNAGDASFAFTLILLDPSPPPAVPEPHSLVLALAGLLGGGLVMRRKRAAAGAACRGVAAVLRS